MDQGTYESLLTDFQQHCRVEANLPDLTATPGNPDAPVVVLIHGIGGNARHWSDPLGLDSSSTWLFDLNARPTGGSGIASSPPYAPASFPAWTQVLRDAGCTTVTWSQARPDDLLQFSTAEAAAVLRSIEARVFAPLDQAAATDGVAIPPLVVLCHSRGGLVARAALKEIGAAGVPHLRQVVTLCTPHRGSYMPKLAAAYNSTLGNAINFDSLSEKVPRLGRRLVDDRLEPFLEDLANRVRVALLHSFGTLAQGPGFEELAPDSPTMVALAANEASLPGVRYASFGGTDPTFIHFYLIAAGRAFHLLATASAFLVGQLARLPGVAERFGGLTELAAGDSAVGPESSKWPETFGAAHQTIPINHMRALIDPALQRAVLDTLRA